MDYEKAVPGLGGLAASGLLAGQLWLPGIAVAVVLAGGIAVRLFFRRKQTPWERSRRRH